MQFGGGCSRQNHEFSRPDGAESNPALSGKKRKTRLYNCIISLLRRKFRRHLDRQRARAVWRKVTIAAKPAVIACKFHITAVSAINAVHEEYRNPSFSRPANHSCHRQARFLLPPEYTGEIRLLINAFSISITTRAVVFQSIFISPSTLSFQKYYHIFLSAATPSFF